MSHQPERIEKNCLNCGTVVAGRYCQTCGQENIVSHQGFWSLTKHFVYDIFHFDGKFFDTLKHLLIRPGTISKEYIAGKRNKYLDPIRMYLFTSALFFLVFFSINKSLFNINLGKEEFGGILNKGERMELAYELSSEAKKDPQDTLTRKKLAQVLDSSHVIVLNKFYKSTVPKDSLVSFNGKTFQMLVSPHEAYRLKHNKSDGWLASKLIKKTDDLESRYGEDMNEGFEKFSETIRHKLPYLLFLSLPFFAGILKLIYIRRKNFYYSDHAVFTLHHYILSFILLLLAMVFNYAGERTGWNGLFSFLVTIVVCLWPIYLYIEMKRFYGQGWFKTLSKFILLNFLGLIVISLLTVVFIVFSVYQI